MFRRIPQALPRSKGTRAGIGRPSVPHSRARTERAHSFRAVLYPRFLADRTRFVPYIVRFSYKPLSLLFPGAIRARAAPCGLGPNPERLRQGRRASARRAKRRRSLMERGVVLLFLRELPAEVKVLLVLNYPGER